MSGSLPAMSKLYRHTTARNQITYFAKRLRPALHALTLGWLLCGSELSAAQQIESAQTMNRTPKTDGSFSVPVTCITPSFVYAAPKGSSGNITVNSNSALLVKDALAVFEGDVSIVSPMSTITANSANILDNGREIRATGNVQYTDALLQVNSEGVEVNSNLKLLQMQETNYKIAGISGRGGAELLSISQERGVSLENVSFTTCPEGNEDWKIQASEISIESGKPFGEAYNTRFFVGGLPIFYLPYFAFPITAERQTGFLFPQFGSSSTTGLEWEQPFYWNIAANVDGLISTRLMTNRGVQLKSEFRYLFDNHAGELQLEYLPNDNGRVTGKERYFYRFFHRGKLSNNWSISADISDLSDDNYIIDLGSDFYNQADTHLSRQAGVNFSSQALDFSVFVRDFTTIGASASNYRALPEAKLNYTNSLNELLNVGVKSELAYFENDSLVLPDALRFHVEPSISIPYQRAWGELLAQASVLHTYYKQDLKDENFGLLEEEVNRTLGQARLYGALIFEKPQRLFGTDYTLTVEPKAQYLFTSFEEQSNIGLYDSTAILTNFNNLFRGQEFTGLDRINDNNQVTLGTTSRLIDSSNNEILIASIGQILYVRDSELIDGRREGNRSSIAAELDWQVNQNWFLRSDIQVGNQSNQVERSALSTEYKLDHNKLVQINHRYIRELSNERIDQVGVTASWPIADNWHWVGRYYRDLQRSRSIETFMGIEYESCCWALRLTLRRNLATRFNNNGVRDLNDFDSGIGLQFVFKGMGNSDRKVDMLSQGLFGYRQPFVLN
ncbi:LPS-assembly protein LptD [Glaciecola punicea]|nr:LPS assembly protein LptD [Glaciecola punicea]